MRNLDNNLDTEVRLWQEKLFSRSVRRANKLNRLSSSLGSTINLQCLEISSGDGVLSAQLRSLGGSWKTAVLQQEEATSLNYHLSETISLIDNEKLPFEDNTFDRLVIVDALKKFNNDYDFLHECHRVIKNDGWVIISETKRAPFSITGILQRIFGLLPSSNGAPRNGYKANELFNILKDGFDVPEILVYSNGFLESFATLGEIFQKIIVGGCYWMIKEQIRQDELYRFRHLFNLANLAYPIMLLLSVLEFIPGHKLMVKSRRRHWRPRRQPKLIDGRSIAEAAINTKIGTAAPF